jgi:hypothetical protein
MLTLDTLALTLAEATTYATSRGLTAWTGTDAAKTAALRRGQDWVAGTFNARWLEEFTDATAPAAVKYAITEAAVRELTTPGILTPDLVPGREKVLTGVKGITWTPLKAGGGASSLVPLLTKVEALLAGLVAPGGLMGGTGIVCRA